MTLLLNNHWPSFYLPLKPLLNHQPNPAVERHSLLTAVNNAAMLQCFTDKVLFDHDLRWFCSSSDWWCFRESCTIPNTLQFLLIRDKKILSFVFWNFSKNLQKQRCVESSIFLRLGVTLTLECQFGMQFEGVNLASHHSCSKMFSLFCNQL